MTDMTWEQKLAALKSLGGAHLEMRSPGVWWVSANVEIGGDGFLSSVIENGATPEDAVDRFWKAITSRLSSTQHLYAGHSSAKRRVKWNGYMWQDVVPSRSNA